jgi:arylsulfatase A-like enzyme
LRDHPNLLYVFGDQWRAQALGVAGDPNARTPNLDRFADQSVHAVNALSCCPVCSPARASLLTGQFPLRHGMFVNDQTLQGDFVSFADALNGAGYDTAYVGKWHVAGTGRSRFVRPELRCGFQYWRAHECTHNYNHSMYYADTDEEPRFWEGYDAEAQTREVCRYLRERQNEDRPFAMFLSWGPPHAPYHTAPERFRRQFDPEAIQLRPNVPEDARDQARQDLAGYYAHIAALDECFGTLLSELEAAGLDDNTIVVFSSDHGDMHGSQNQYRKQRPYDESARIPFVVRAPGLQPREVTTPIDVTDHMPTLLSLCGVDVPETVEGEDLSDVLHGQTVDEERPALLACYMPFHQAHKPDLLEYRGLRTARYTYIRHLDAPWLLFDNHEDPYQMTNLVDDPAHAAVRERLEAALQRRLADLGDEFLPGEEYLARYQIRLNEDGDIFYE